MRTASTNLPCPICGAQATITLSEPPQSSIDDERHRIDFRCRDASHRVGEADLLQLWTKGRADLA